MKLIHSDTKQKFLVMLYLLMWWSCVN